MSELLQRHLFTLGVAPLVMFTKRMETLWSPITASHNPADYNGIKISPKAEGCHWMTGLIEENYFDQ